jgi:hypothetical protein
MKKMKKQNAYECPKGVWKEPVLAADEREARQKLECDDCKLFPRECGGLGEMEKKNLAGLSCDEKASVVLAELARRIPNQRGGRRESVLRPFVRKHLEEIEAAYRAGHTYKAIVAALAEAGVKIAVSTLRRELKLALWEREKSGM